MCLKMSDPIWGLEGFGLSISALLGSLQTFIGVASMGSHDPQSTNTDLVGGWAYLSEKYELVNWDDEIPNWVEK